MSLSTSPSTATPNNPVTKLDIKAGDTISIVGTLTINAFSGLPGLSIVNMEKHN